MSLTPPLRSRGLKFMIGFEKGRSESAANAEADLDAQQAILWYDERDRKLGDAFLENVNDCITSVEKNPERYPVIHREMRRALVKRFPYEVTYEIENDEIIIYAIYHCARDPRVWKRRRDA